MKFQKGNKFSEGLTNSGRPPIWDDPDKMIERIIEYFEYILGEEDGEEQVTITDRGITKTQTVTKWKRKPEPPTITGLHLFLGFAHKDSLYDYAKKPEFSDPIKRALALVEQSYEFGLRGTGSTGSIFALKNMGWKDMQEHKNTHEGGINIFRIPDNDRDKDN